MTEFTDDDLLDFVRGRPSPHTEAIAAQERADEEFAAELAVIRLMTGAADRTASPAPGCVASARAWLHRYPRVAAAVLLLAFLGSGAWAGWAYVHRPLFEDHFRRRTFDANRWLAVRPQLRQEYGYMKLTNRGYLVTRPEFDGPIELSFRWRWVDLTENPLYSDDLTVVLRTTGTPEPAMPYEVQDGVKIRFMSYGSRVIVMTPAIRSGVSTPPGAVWMPPDAWMDIRIIDDGQTVTVYVSGSENGGRDPAQPVLVAQRPEAGTLHRIAFYNRELLAMTPHESHITDVVVRSLR